MFRLAPLLVLAWHSVTTTRHLPGWSGLIRSSPTFCNSLKLIPSLIPCATTRLLGTCSTASVSVRLDSRYVALSSANTGRRYNRIPGPATAADQSGDRDG